MYYVLFISVLLIAACICLIQTGCSPVLGEWSRVEGLLFASHDIWSLEDSESSMRLVEHGFPQYFHYSLNTMTWADGQNPRCQRQHFKKKSNHGAGNCWETAFHFSFTAVALRDAAPHANLAPINTDGQSTWGPWRTDKQQSWESVPFSCTHSVPFMYN